jgi:succinate dehydrogenase / fumarate reductase membrane anchor subunit
MANTRSLSNATAERDQSMLRRVRHLGSARNGLQEWRLQRRTALALIPLGLYFVASMLRLATSDQMSAAAWLASPVPALLTILFMLTLLSHAVVGLRSILIDYVTRVRVWLLPNSRCAVLPCFSRAQACSRSSSSSLVGKEANNAKQLRHHRPFV